MENYTVRINRAVDYITENLSEEINLEDIANVVEISKYHFHKIFKSVIGETPSEFIKRLRLEKSAGMLICTDKSMIIIAIEYGFSSSSVFSREFKKKYLLSPRDFRTFFQFYNSNNKYDSFSFEEKIKSNQNISEIMRISKHIIFNRDMAFKIETLPEYKVIYMRTIGEYTDYSSIHSLWMKLKEFAVANSLYDKNIKLFSLIHDNPNICIKGKCRYDACFSISSDKDIKI